MLKGFKEFLLRGNVIDLAVAVVIGAAFNAIVQALVNNVFNPAIGALFRAESLNTLPGLTVRVPALTPGAEDAKIEFGFVLSALIQFLIVAAVVYFVLIVPMNYLRKRAEERKSAGEPPVAADTPPTELEVLQDIRALLAAQASGEPATTEGHGKHSA